MVCTVYTNRGARVTRHTRYTEHMRTLPHTSRIHLIIAGTLLMLLAWHLFAVHQSRHADATYDTLASMVTYDRTGTIAQITANTREQLALFLHEYPPEVSALVLAKEDEWFYYHPGIHPVRTLTAIGSALRGHPNGGASTITQQLARILLNTSNERTLRNKVREALLALALEHTHTKDRILTMYLNTAPLGGNVQGFATGAHAYFGKSVDTLNESELLQLVSALSRPNSARPLTEHNLSRAHLLAQTLGTSAPLSSNPEAETGTAWLERADLMVDCPTCNTSLDISLTERLRELLARHVERTKQYRGTHGAIAVLDAKTGEVLALVGSPNPDSNVDGMRINMALATRPVGSTIKPFLFLQGFSKGLRPYTIVQDRELKFDIGTGYPLYPKNYDGTFKGAVTLEESLANSLNIPAVEVQQFITSREVYRYLGATVGFQPSQEWESYGYGIALGGLELDLLTLTHAFSAFANKGVLHPLIVGTSKEGTPHHFTPPHSTLTLTRSIGTPEEVVLVNAILTDRTAGVEQFGTKGSLHLSHEGYGVKTGTSRDYHDSWTVGFTGEYVVGVWLGNAENRPMHGVSGAIGAGTLWRDVMELMYTTPYYTGTPLDLTPLVRIPNERGYSYGLPDDDVETARSLLTPTTHLHAPHEGDTFLYTEGMRIPLETDADNAVEWFVDGTPLTPRNGGFYPPHAGDYTLTAKGVGWEERVTIHVKATPTKLP
jgi:penicillin-binding protein 1C